MTENLGPTPDEGAASSPPPRWPWWLLGNSVGQAVLTMLGPIVLLVVTLVTAVRIGQYVMFWLSILGLAWFLACGIATVVALRRHPELERATRQRRPFSRLARHRYSVATLIGFVLAVVAFVIGAVIQTFVVWIAFAVLLIVTFFCFVQIGRPILGQGTSVGPTGRPYTY